jgi:hypothetical protein
MPTLAGTLELATQQAAAMAGPSATQGLFMVVLDKCALPSSVPQIVMQPPVWHAGNDVNYTASGMSALFADTGSPITCAHALTLACVL